ncbi:pectin lyase fold/virulence factor [Xylariales sp. PMI_506]|nr:pectin lyase fold/virulence factor [Xylariales sp. PMI_506]
MSTEPAIDGKPRPKCILPRTLHVCHPFAMRKSADDDQHESEEDVFMAPVQKVTVGMPRGYIPPLGRQIPGGMIGKPRQIDWGEELGFSRAPGAHNGLFEISMTAPSSCAKLPRNHPPEPNNPILLANMLSLALIGIFATSVDATARTSPPSGSITVCSSGCDYSTIQAAVSSISTSSTTAHSIFIYSGTYTEQVTIPALSAKLTIYGETANTASYTSNVVNLEWAYSAAEGYSDEETAALINLSENVAVYNINIKNTYGAGSQAIALSAYNAEQGYYGVGLYGYQDTLLAETGTQVYANCYIQGAVDFIFGQHAPVWITKSTIAVSAGGGCITANGRASSTDPSFYVINDCTIETASGASVGEGTVYLGRPWSEYARVVYQNSALSDIISSAGWSEWSSSEPNTEYAVFEEYDNNGDGSNTADYVSFSSVLSSAISITTILGSDYEDWVDTSYL